MQIYIEDQRLALLKYTHEDDRDMYKCWKNKDTQRGHNYIITESFEEFTKNDLSVYRFFAVIYDKRIKRKVGCLRLSRFLSNPDLSIWIYKKHRKKGYGKHAYYLGLKYCFETLHLPQVSAGCYESNYYSHKILTSLGMIRDRKNDMYERNVFTGERMLQLSYKLDYDHFLSKTIKQSFRNSQHHAQQANPPGL